MSIKLHKRLGPNPRMSFCPKCGGDASALALIGDANFKGVCPEHGDVYGLRARAHTCSVPNCGRQLSDVVELTDYEKVPSPMPCTKCAEGLALQKKAIEEGGIAWRCCTCGSEGAFILGEDEESNAQIRAVRQRGYTGVEIPGCPVCAKKQEENNAELQG